MYPLCSASLRLAKLRRTPPPTLGGEKEWKICMSKDYYKILGVDKNASESDIKKAFRTLAQKYHPDKHGGDEKKFKEANEAYQVLSDKQKRAQYDQFGSEGPNMSGFGGQGFGGFGFSGFRQRTNGNVEFDFSNVDIDDILSQFGMGGFGGFGRRRGKDAQIHVELTFKEAVMGVEKEVEVPDLSSGNDNGKNKKVKITIPSGVDSGQRLRLSGYGFPSKVSGGEFGDLYLVMVVKPHPTLHREGKHLITHLDVKLTDALLGGEYKVATLDGNVSIKIPEGLQPGQILRVRGKGVRSHGMFGHGDLLIKTKIIIPKKLSKEGKNAVETMKNEGL